MNHEMNDINQSSQDSVTDFSNFGLNFQDPMHGITEKHYEAVGNSPEQLDLNSSETKMPSDRPAARQAGATKPDSTQQWIQQFGSSGYDKASEIAIDSSGNVYLAGSTEGDLAGENAGGYDAWIAKYDVDGNQLWSKQFGTFYDDYSSGITIDSSDNVYLAGYTYGDLTGENSGSSDIWLTKYLSDGNNSIEK